MPTRSTDLPAASVRERRARRLRASVSPRGRVAARLLVWIAVLVVCGGCGRSSEHLTGEALLEALPRRADIVLEEGELLWRSSGGSEYRVRAGILGRHLRLELDSGETLDCAWSLTDPAFEDPLGSLPRLVERLRAARADAGRARAPRKESAQEHRPLYRFDPLADAFVIEADGLHIDEDAVLEPIVPVERLASPRIAHAAARSELATALGEVDAWIEVSELTSPSKHALREILERATRRDDANEDYPSPSFVRRMIRSGWLDQLAQDDPRAARFTRAIERTERWTLTRALGRDARLRLQLRDAYGRSLVLHRTPESVRYQVSLPAPAYFADVAPLELVVELEPGADPFAPAPELRSARVYQDDVRVAEWTVEGGFRAWPRRWRARVTSEIGGQRWVLPDALPPHVLVVTPYGDVRSLITAHGRIDPVTANDAAAVESFVASAASALPDAAHLDLLGEYLYAYVHDSPDPRFPQLIGTQSMVGDIHQTVQQTLAAPAGGLYRGDCDDLSELYQEIVRRQGRNAHLLGLPAHAALGWNEPRHGRHWTFVLQTAPPLAVPGDTLEASLEAAYRSFDPDAAIDPEQLEIMLRFAGDNTRDSYYLSARVFADASYARTMIALQEDWHRFSFYAALAKIERVLADDPHRTAHLLERASLESMVSRPMRAALGYASARERASSSLQRVQIAIQELEAWFRAGEERRAASLLSEISNRWMPEVEAQAGERAFDLWLALAGELLERDRAPERALDILSDKLAPRVRARDRWYDTLEQRYRLQQFMELGIETLRAARRMGAGDEMQRRSLERLIGSWFESGAFVRTDPSESLLRTYGWLGRYLEAVHGREDYERLVFAQEPPESARRNHERRFAEPRRAARDAAWIGISPYYWWKALGDLVSWHHASLDRPRALRLAHQLRVAQVRARALGLDHPEFAMFAVHSRIVSSIAARNPEQLRAALRSVRESGDRELAAGAAFWLAQLGRRTPLSEFESYLRVALQEIDVPAMFLRIAWDSIAADAWDHGLLAARLIASAHPELPHIEAEARFMQSLRSRTAQEAVHAARAPLPSPPSIAVFPAETGKN